MSEAERDNTTEAPPAGTPVERGAALFEKIGGTSIREELGYMRAAHMDPLTYAAELLAYLEAVGALAGNHDGFHFSETDEADLAAYIRFAAENPPVEWPYRGGRLYRASES